MCRRVRLRLKLEQILLLSEKDGQFTFLPHVKYFNATFQKHVLNVKENIFPDGIELDPVL